MVLRSIVLRAIVMASRECPPGQESCVFCGIVNANDPNKIIYQDDDVVVFPDIKPAAPYHYLIIPRSHLPNPKDITSTHKTLVEHMVKVGNDLMREKDPELTNSRFGFHWPPFTSVPHLHLHAISPVDCMSFISKVVFRQESYWFVSPEYVLSRL